jgi:hypothetical protein
MKQQRRKPGWLQGKNQGEKPTGESIIREIGLNHLPIGRNDSLSPVRRIGGARSEKEFRFRKAPGAFERKK